MGPLGKPHLNLQEAVRQQLERLGVRRVHRVDLCTRCQQQQLYSYRRDGQKAGRNVAMIWLR
jgi:copper oxidase (laccase) domain-containing protein